MHCLALALSCTFFAQGSTPSDAEALSSLEAIQSAVIDAIATAESSVVAITRARSEDGKTLAVVGRDDLPDNAPPGARFPIALDDLTADDYLPLPGDFGSGVVIGPSNQILTTFHIIQGSARILVRAPGGQTFDAEILAADPRSDLAVLVPRPPVRDEAPPRLTPIELGDADTLKKGAFLLALGNPYHTARDGRASASWGILANKTRRIAPPVDGGPEVRQLFRHQPTLLQLDSKLNLGMSGGAVVNLRGELVGITTTGGNVEGYDAQAGYAIPLDALGRRVVETLKEGKEAEYGFLGIRLNDRAPNVVGGVEPGTPAEQGGLLLGDEIVAVNGHPVTAETGLSLALGIPPVGQPVELTVRRGSREFVSQVLLSKYPVAGEVIATNRPEPWRGLRVDFTSALAGSTFSDAILELMSRGCVGVVGVVPGSPAAAAGLKRGQVISAVEDQPVRTPQEFAKAIEGLSGAVTLTIVGVGGETKVEIASEKS